MGEDTHGTARGRLSALVLDWHGGVTRTDGLKLFFFFFLLTSTRHTPPPPRRGDGWRQGGEHASPPKASDEKKIDVGVGGWKLAAPGGGGGSGVALCPTAGRRVSRRAGTRPGSRGAVRDVHTSGDTRLMAAITHAAV